MKVYKYKFNNEAHDDLGEIVSESLIKELGEFKIETYVHANADEEYFFIGSQEDQNKMINIIKDLEKTFKNYKGDIYYCEYLLESVEDVTEDFFKNIENYDSFKNQMTDEDKNTLLEYYHEVMDADTVLDKISYYGVDALSKYDKEILEKSVK